MGVNFIPVHRRRYELSMRTSCALSLLDYSLSELPPPSFSDDELGP
jgi:hypothetical protein